MTGTLPVSVTPRRYFGSPLRAGRGTGLARFGVVTKTTPMNRICAHCGDRIVQTVGGRWRSVLIRRMWCVLTPQMGLLHMPLGAHAVVPSEEPRLRQCVRCGKRHCASTMTALDVRLLKQQRAVGTPETAEPFLTVAQALDAGSGLSEVRQELLGSLGDLGVREA